MFRVSSTLKNHPALMASTVLASIANSPTHSLAAAAPQAETAFVFVDAGLRQRNLLAFGILPNSHVVQLQPGVALLDQIASHLKGQRGVTAIHIITEGQNAAVLTMDSRLDMAALASMSQTTKNTIRQALAPGADILLYGCNIAADVAGRQLVDALAAGLGSDVAASDDDTGHANVGADWNLEYQTGSIEAPIIVTEAAQAQWQDKLAIGLTVAGNTNTLINALGPTGMNGVTYSGTPTILGVFGSNAYGTFTTTGSNLGMASGAVFGTGNITQISGAPGFFWDGAGTGNTSGSERDRAALTYSFAPNVGVTKIVYSYTMGSEEYNEYVGQGFSDNITIRLTGGIYAGTNVATIPGGSTGVDIDTINNGLNAIYYRDNTVASPPVPDSVLDGHTTVLRSITTVVPGTTYSAEIKVADFLDNRYNTAFFVNYFGASLQLDLDSNNSSGATLANYQTTFTEGGSSVAVVDTDRTIINYDTTSIQSATITLTNAQTLDSLTFSGLPAGITGTTNTSVPGVITVTLTGASTIANYQTALSTLRFANSSSTPNTTLRNVTVVVNDGATNSNTAVTSITVVNVVNYTYTVAKSASVAAIAAPGNITYTITLVNTGDGNMTGVAPTDTLTQGAGSTGLTLTGPTGDGGTIGQFGVGETWVYTATLPVTQARMDNGNNLVNTISVTTTQTSPTAQTAQATTTITKNPLISMVKTATPAGPFAAGDVVTYTYVVSNAGNLTISNINVGDVHDGHGPAPTPSSEILATDVAPLLDSTDGAPAGTWTSLAPGDAVQFSANYIVTQDDVDLLQ